MSEVETTSLAAFAAQLRSWRQRIGWTQVQLADQIGYSDSLVSGVETLDKVPSADFAKMCDKVFSTPGFDEKTGMPGLFLTLQELISREAYPAWFAPVVEFERDAVRIHCWELGVVPGLLQTEPYARAVISARWPAKDEGSIDRLVTGRIKRQEILSRECPPMLWYVLHEGLLRHVIGSQAIMAEQLDKLIKMAGMSGIVLQVLPYGAHDHAGVEGPIVIYDRRNDPTVGYTECHGGGRIIEAQDEVADLTTVMSMLRAAALPPRESVAAIQQIRRELDD